ncbi:MAG TPA: hypothetical protein VGC42_03255, partial [Kofleriaceae bacterium]
MRRALLLAVALGCRAAAPPPAMTVQRTPLAVAGALVAAVEQAGTLYLFAPERATIERGGALIARIPAPDGAWAEAGIMPALDEPGSWVVARTAKGSLWRITTTGELEPIHDLLGLAPEVRALGAAGGTLGLALDGGVAVLRDPAHVERFAIAAARAEGGEVSAAHDRLAIRRGPVIDVWDLAAHRHATLTVPGALAAGFASADGRGRLVVATAGALFLEAPGADPAGALHRLAAPAELRRLAIAGARIWIATAGGVFVVDGDHLTRAGVEAAATDRVLGLASGDVLLGTPSSLTRLALARPADDPRWAAEVAPIYQRVCARCHAPGGDAGLDLSTAAAWRHERTELRHRVVESRTMPPAGTPMS